MGLTMVAFLKSSSARDNGLLLLKLGLRLGDSGFRAAEIHLRGVLLIERELIVLIGVVTSILCDQAACKHGLRTFAVTLQERQIRTFRIHFVALVIRLRAIDSSLGKLQRRFGFAKAWQQVVLVQFAQHLSFVNHISEIDGKLLNNAAGFTFDLDLRHRLNFSSRHDGARQIALLHFGQLFGVDFDRGVAERLERKCSSGGDHGHHGYPNKSCFFARHTNP